MKDRIREELKRRRNTIPAVQKVEWDRQILTEVVNLADFVRAKAIMTFLSFGSEINTWPLVEHTLELGKTLTVPKLVGKPQHMVAVKIEALDQLQAGIWGIMEPRSSTAYPLQGVDLIVVPGLSFSLEGYRLGYGGGFYDQFLASFSGVTVGVCYEQFIGDVPIDPWDVPVTMVVTERHVYQKRK